MILDKIITKNQTRLDQMLSTFELSKLLRDFCIIIPVEKLNQILIFMELNPFTFTLEKFTKAFSNCKILASEITTDEIIKIFYKLKDIIYSLGGERFFFGDNPKENDTLSRKKFVQFLKSKEVNLNYTEEILEAVFNFLSKTERDLTLAEFRRNFQETRKNELTEDFENHAINLINQKIIKSSAKANEYFDQLLLKKANRFDNNIRRVDLHKLFRIDGFDFSAEEIDYIFDRMDYRKDDLIDREEFIKFVSKVHNALYKIKDIIKRDNLEIEDLLFRMVIDRHTEKDTKRYDLLNFKMSNDKLVDFLYF